jgi:hypothetical protein
MYDSLSDHDYDNTCQSGEIFFSRRNFEKKNRRLILDFVSNLKPTNSSPESSSRSSGIYSTNDPHLSSSSSSESYPNIINSNKSVSSSKLIRNIKQRIYPLF